MQLLCAEFGPRACEFYLGAWLRASERPEAEHRAFNPTRADIAAYKASAIGQRPMKNHKTR